MRRQNNGSDFYCRAGYPGDGHGVGAQTFEWTEGDGIGTDSLLARYDTFTELLSRQTRARYEDNERTE